MSSSKKHKKEKKEKKEKKSKKEKKEKKKKKHKKSKREDHKSSSSSSSSTSASTSSIPTNYTGPTITKDDYFRRGPNFRLWLTQSKNLDFEDLETIQARVFFDEFVKLWNNGQLASIITNPSNDTLRSNPRTKFAWGIQTSKQEKYDLDTLHDSVTAANNASGVKRKSGTLGPAAGPPRKKVMSSKNNLILARAKAAEAAEDAKMAQFRRDMGLE
tara:strand:- start:62 stop:706 length:645 start_codon:yes stop_codon:yes gene_type:complete